MSQAVLTRAAPRVAEFLDTLFGTETRNTVVLTPGELCSAQKETALSLAFGAN